MEEFIKQKGIPERDNHWKWYERMVADFVLLRFSERADPLAVRGDLVYDASSHIVSFYNFLEGIWFDFESLQLAPTQGYASWNEAAETIEKNTKTFKKVSGELLDFTTTKHFADSFTELKKRLIREGLTRREVVEQL